MHDHACFECGVAEGENHALGCEIEPCPFCGKTRGACSVAGHEVAGHEPFPGPPCNKLAELAVTDPRRVPHVDYPVYLCAKCGCVEPPLFFLADEVWTHYVDPRHRESILCRPCFDIVVAIVDAVRPRPDWCGFLWAPDGPDGEHQMICTRPRGHGGREHASGDYTWFRHCGRVWPAACAALVEP